MTMRSLVAKAKRQPMLPLTLGAILVAGGLFCIDAFLAGRLLQATASAFATLAAAAMAWNLMRSGTAIRRLRREQRELSRRPVIVNPAPPAPAPAPQPTGRDRHARLNHIGSFNPLSAASASEGRIAGQRPTDPEAAYRLFVATQRPGGRAIALVGSQQLEQVVGAHGTVTRLHPGMSAAEVDAASPQVLIVDEDALCQPPWTGAVEAHGAKLLLELRVAMAALRRAEGLIYVLKATNTPGPAAPALRADTTVIDGSVQLSDPDGSPNLFVDLVRYRAGKAEHT